MPPITLKKRYQYNPDTDLLGEGGLGTVYKAYDNEHERYVAIKKFNVTGNLKYSLKNEFQKSIGFSHGNLVRAYDFFSTTYTLPTGETHETQYGIMELIEGGDLASYLKTNPPHAELLEVVKGILRGLDYLHTPDPNTNKGVIIHRDIKPANILIFRNNAGKPIPKITDFNIAKEASTDLSTQTVVGTPEYMSPEQFVPKQFGSNGKVQPNTDLWSLGVLLCDHLMQKSTFGKRSTGQAQGEIMDNVLRQALPTTEIDRLPAPFKQIITACLVRHATDRIQSADALLQVLKTSPPPPKIARKEPAIIIDAPAPQPPIYAPPTIILPAPLQQLAYDMVQVQGGTFTMGSPASEADRGSNEQQHPVTLSTFSISKYEVTQAQWRAIMGDNPSFFEGDDLPVENVSWDDIQTFLQKLNAQTGKSYSLPTEAEWEYAARGGSHSNGYEYAGSNSLSRVAWYLDNSDNRTHTVGQKQPNELGLYDMSGNVWEWCNDWYDDYPSSPTNNPTGPTEGAYRVLRGGSWYYDAQDCRVADRDIDSPTNRRDSLGFRLSVR